MSELHGNRFKEYCEICRADYIRAFDVTIKRSGRYTGRLCQDESLDEYNCDGSFHRNYLGLIIRGRSV